MTPSRALGTATLRRRRTSLGGLIARQHRSGHLLAVFGIFATGIVTGVALAVLFAPKPGAELRQEIGTRVRGLSDKIAKTEQRAARKPA
jgi:hypothetical protein